MAPRREEARQNGSCYGQPGAYIAIEAIEVGDAAMVENEPEIEWHRDLVAKNRALIKELEATNTTGGEVFPETQAEIDRLKAQTEQSKLIVAAYEKQLKTSGVPERNVPVTRGRQAVGAEKAAGAARLSCPGPYCSRLGLTAFHAATSKGPCSALLTLGSRYGS